MPWLHISLPAPPCSILCPGYAAHIRRSTILCRRRSIQSLGSALPVDASAGQISSQPYHTVALPSYALPTPCPAVQRHCPSLHCPSGSKQFPSLHFHFPAFRSNAMPRLFAAMPCLCGAMLCQSDSLPLRSMPMQIISLHCRGSAVSVHAQLIYAFPKQLPSVHCRACATLCLACAAPRPAVPCLARADLLMTFPKRDFSMHCLCKSALSRYRTRLCNSGAELNATVSSLINSPHCHHHSIHCLCCSDHFCAATIPYRSLPTQIFSLPQLYESLLRLAGAHPCLALPVPITAMLCDTIA